MNKAKDLDTYISDLTENGFSRENIIVEHRSNNPKRDFLFVNRKQCKHIPCSPREMIAVCKSLADEVKTRLSPESRVAVVAFAETATAVGNIVADEISQVTRVFQTTREPLEDCEVLFEFREEHSHAVQQRIYGSRELFGNVDYILMVDDEITTGKTVLNFIEGLNREGINSRFGIASLCNWQSDSERERFREKGIDVFCLLSGKIRDVNRKIEGVKILPESECKSPYTKRIETLEVNISRKERLGHEPNRDLSVLFAKSDELRLEGDTIRVVGTEEFMYVPIRVAEYLEHRGFSVVCHSTTRSPIDVTDIDPNGIRCKIQLPSVYDRARQTFLYNFDEHTDVAVLVTDANISGGDIRRFSGILNCDTLIVVRVKEGKCG